MANENENLNVGSIRTLRYKFYNAAGALSDPTTVTIYVQLPDGTVVDYTYADSEVLKNGTGDYQYDLTLTQKGAHADWPKTTGTPKLVGPKRWFYVGDPSA